MAKCVLKGKGNSGNDVFMTLYHQDTITKIPAVVKRAKVGSLQGITRLKAQIEKMTNYVISIQPRNPALFEAPKVYCIDNEHDGTFQAIMEYVPYADALEFLGMASLEQVNWFSNAVIHHIEAELEVCNHEELKDIMPHFMDKAEQLRKTIGENEFLSQDDVISAFGILDLAIEYGKQLVSKEVSVPVGFSHGDLTLSNILISGESRKAYVIDFLDTFVNSPLQDIVKFRQDTKHKWITFLEESKGDMGRILVTLDYIDKHFVANFETQAFWPAVALFDAFSLLRLLPYIKAGPLLTMLRSRLREVQATLRIETQPSREVHLTKSRIFVQSLPVKHNSTSVTVVVPAAGRSSRFPGTRPKVFLTNPNGLLMVVDALRGLNIKHVSRILIGVLRDHVDEYCGGSVDGILACITKLSQDMARISEIIVIEKETADPVETVENIIVHGKVFLLQPHYA